MTRVINTDDMSQLSRHVTRAIKTDDMSQVSRIFFKVTSCVRVLATSHTSQLGSCQKCGSLQPFYHLIGNKVQHLAHFLPQSPQNGHGLVTSKVFSHFPSGLLQSIKIPLDRLRLKHYFQQGVSYIPAPGRNQSCISIVLRKQK